MHHPGEVWFLPREAREGGDAKGRRHVLLTACRDADDHATLAYASSRDREARRGGAFVTLDPNRTAYGRQGRTGFDRLTYIYPCRLVGSMTEDLERMTGRLIDEMPEIRSKLVHALGMGTGSCDGEGPARNSWRGRVVSLVKSLADEIGSECAVVLTEPRYSNRGRYQIFAPLLDPDEFERDVLDVRIEDPALLRLGLRWEAALIATRLVQSAFHPEEIVGSTGIVLSDAVMARIDERLRALFAL